MKNEIVNENNLSEKDFKNELEQFYPMIKALASKWMKKPNPRVSFEDLVSIGQITLWEASKTYISALGYNKSTYYWTCISRAMAKYCLKHRYQLKYSIGKKVSFDEVNEREKRMVKISDYPDIFFIESKADSPLENSIAEEQKENLRRELAQLGDIEQKLFNEGKKWKGNKSYKEIAAEVGLSPQRIYQIERKLVEKLRKKKSLQ